MTVKSVSFAGSWPAILTPFDGDGSVNLAHLSTLATRMENAGSDGLLALGTVGEGYLLDISERREVLSALKEVGPIGNRVIVGVAGETTQHACHLAEEAAEAGAFALMCLPPTGSHASDEELHRHFSDVSRASGLPVMLYNHPEICHNDLTPEQISNLFEIPGVVALKECDADARKISRVSELTDGGIQVSVGGDDIALALFAAGAVGWLPGTANVFPEECVALAAAAARGDLHTLRELYMALLPIMRLDAHDDCSSLLKAAVAETGLAIGGVRSPGTLTAAHRETARVAVASARDRLHRLASK